MNDQPSPNPAPPLDYHRPSPSSGMPFLLFVVSLCLVIVSIVGVVAILIVVGHRISIYESGQLGNLQHWFNYTPWSWMLLALSPLLAAAVLAGIGAHLENRFYEWLRKLLTRIEYTFVALTILTLGFAIRNSVGASREADWKEVLPDWGGFWAALFCLAVFALMVALKATISGDSGIVAKQMRQRALGTWLTLLSVLLGVALAMAVLLINRESGRLFGQTDFGYDLIIGPPKGSKLTLVLNTVYHMEQSEGVIPYSLYEEMSAKGTDYGKQVRMAVPFMVGDSYKGRRIVGTSPEMIGYDDDGNRMEHPWQYRRDRSFELAEGKPFHPYHFEAVVGSQIAADLKLHVFDPPKPGETMEQAEARNEASGGAFRATHGMPAEGETPDIHKPKWHITGILKPTGTANDRVLFVPVVSLYAINEHSSGMLEQKLLESGINLRLVSEDRIPEIAKKLGFDPDHVPPSVMKKFRASVKRLTTQPATKPADNGGELLSGPKPAKEEKPEEAEPDAWHYDDKGNIVVDLPRDEWALSAILVKTRAPFMTESMLYNFKVINNEAQAASPARVMREFFDTFLKGTTYILLAVAALVSVVAAVSILVSIYNSVSARQKEIAILRALGATRGKVLSLICLEAGAIGLLGGILGFLVGHGMGAIASVLFRKVLGEGIEWWGVDQKEIFYLAGVVIVAVLAGLVPALKAYRVPVVTNLMAG